MLTIENLWVSTGEKEILKGVKLAIGDKETHVLIGPNACGKTTLALAILGYPAYKVTNGSIVFDGQDLIGKNISERAKLGIGLAYQNPPEVRGVKLRDIIRLIAGNEPWDLLVESKERWATPFLERVGLNAGSFLTRDINLGFSGGEKKRSELAQVFAMRAKLMLLDEPDSGIDIDSVKLIGTEIGRAAEELRSSVLVITHHRHILQYLEPDVAHVMYGGRIISSGETREIISKVEEEGYERYAKKILGGKCEWT